MKLKDWLRERKRRREAAKMNKLRKMPAQEPAPLTPLDADTEGITPPESRFTDEYREFLKEQQSVSQGNMISREEK